MKNPKWLNRHPSEVEKRSRECLDMGTAAFIGLHRDTLEALLHQLDKAEMDLQHYRDTYQGGGRC
jgi:hypothetical protein